jgi:uncharacterized protein (TIGR02596 family)
MEHEPDQLMTFRSGFSLVELLTVVAIMAVLTVLTGPPLAQALRGGRLSLSTDTVEGVLEQARLSALSRQRPVEVRFYAYSDPTLPGKPGGVHALQALVVGDSGVCSPIGPPRALADRIVITTNPTLTSLWSQPAVVPQSSIPRVGLAYVCRSFRFLPDGGTSLSSAGSATPWCLTLLSASDDQSGAVKPPRNFSTIVIDPLTGTRKTYRPSLR